MNHFSHLVILILAFLSVSCSDDAKALVVYDEENIDPSGISDSVESIDCIRNEGFKSLVLRFERTSLPLYFGLDSKLLEKFELVHQYSSIEERYEKARIPIDTAIHYFLDNNAELNKQPSGGIYEYYYGYNIPTKGNYILLLYFRPSGDEYSYRLATFDFDGKLIDDIGLAGHLGQNDPKTQREFVINNDLSITIEQLTIDMTSYNYDENLNMATCKVDRVDLVYSISDKGEFLKAEEKILGNFDYFEQDLSVGGFRFVSDDSMKSLFR